VPKAFTGFKIQFLNSLKNFHSTLDDVFFFLLLLPGSIPASPENITVTFINPTSVRVSWQQPMDIAFPIEKYDVTYKPTDARYKQR
jgi:hypothetical protein